MVTAVSCAQVPEFTVIIGGSYGAGTRVRADARSIRGSVDVANASWTGTGSSVPATVKREQIENGKT